MFGLKDINSDKYWFCSHLTMEPKEIRASHHELSNAHGASDKVATYTAAAGKTIGGESMSAPIIAPLTPNQPHPGALGFAVLSP